MALGLLYTRRCEQRFKAYVPKRRLFHYLTGQHVDWGSIDQHDEERDESGINRSLNSSLNDRNTPFKRFVQPSRTRTSPLRAVKPAASKYPSSAIAYLRLLPINSRN